MKQPKPRTLTQNNALHLWFSHISQELNEHGLTIQKTLEHTIDIPWSDKSVKESLFRPIMKAQLGKKSTTELTTKEIDLMIDTIIKFLGEKLGLRVDYPSIESQAMKELLKSKD